MAADVSMEQNLKLNQKIKAILKMKKGPTPY